MTRYATMNSLALVEELRSRMDFVWEPDARELLEEVALRIEAFGLEAT